MDVVVRGGGLGLIATAVVLEPSHLVLVGTLIDPELRAINDVLVSVDVVINVSLDPELADGAHVQRETHWTVATDDGQQLPVEWIVEPHELPDGYALQDARVRMGDLEIRAFAIEDLLATVGVGLAAGISGLALWLHHRQAGAAIRAAERQFRECLERGGFPTIRYGVNEVASLTPDARLNIDAGVNYEVRCAPPSS